MAEATEEDVVPPGPERGEDDISDETQDFRFISHLTSPHAGKIPKRGEKDFEPHETALQSSTLEASRAAMHATIAVERIHFPKYHVTAVYDEDRGMAVVDKVKGQHFRTMGRAEGPRVWLLPEEALYLLERGSLDIRWPAALMRGGTSSDEEETEGGQESIGVPMSLQGAYAAFIGMEAVRGAAALTLERYTVYAALKRAGYIVLRADEWDGTRRGATADSALQTVKSNGEFTMIGFFAHIWRLLASGSKRHQHPSSLPLGPLVTPGIYRSYGEIYSMLQIFPPRTLPATIPHSSSEPVNEPLRIAFNVYKPSPTFRKSAPGPPDFRICVLNCRETSVPTLAQLEDLFSALPPDPPSEGSQMYKRLKHGHRNVVLAVVDQGVVSYLRIAQPDFEAEKIYERQSNSSGGKRGGFGKGRGRRGRR